MNDSRNSSPAGSAQELRPLDRRPTAGRNGAFAFFGVQADEVRTLYQRAAAARRAAERLDDHLTNLSRQRRELAERCRGELDQRQRDWQETEAAWRQAAQETAARNSERDRLAAALSSFWTCLGLLVRRWFQPASPSLGALRERLRTLSREACDAERRFEELALRRRVAEEQWRELATPLESLDFALAYLQRLRVSCRQEARQCLAAVDQEIQDAVLGSEIQVLIAKCRQLAGAVDPASVLHAALMLKQALLGFDASSGPATDEIHPLSGTPADRLAQAIEAGFVWGEGSATGEMHLQGEGRQRVRARPGSASPVSTASPRLRSLRPARGSLVEVSLSGCLPVTFSFRFRRWTAEALSRWLAAEARYHFQLGWHHPAALQRREGRAATEATAAQLTAEIRRLWEQAARCDAPAAS